MARRLLTTKLMPRLADLVLALSLLALRANAEAPSDHDSPTPDAVAGQRAPPPTAQQIETVSAAGGNSTPLPRDGFQLALRTGFSIPWGNLASPENDDYLDSPMSRVFLWQVPVIVDVGSKVTHHLFLGCYLGLGVGDAGQIRTPCAGPGCSTYTYRFGAEIQYQFLPGGPADPWVGYGLGYESSKAVNHDITVSASGPEFGHLMGGLDFRPNRWLGGGPFIDVSIGEFTSERSVFMNSGLSGLPPQVVDAPHLATSLHGWLSFGVRAVILP